jgi:hypothetical protein
MTGPGFKPTIQAEALEGLSRKDAAWKPSSIEEQRRRAIYMFSQRSLLPPLMTTFDSSDTILPCVQRPVSTVAPQALALLNNAFAHERSQALARRAMEPEGGLSAQRVMIPAPPQKQVVYAEDNRRILLAWQYALGRDPSNQEMADARQHFEWQVAHFGRTQLSTQDSILPRAGMALHLSADKGVTRDEDDLVVSWKDQSGRNHHASQPVASQRPRHVRPPPRWSVQFDGQKRFLHLAGQVVTSQSFAIFAVVTDQSDTIAHREIFSNWDGTGNVGSSLFFGMTGTKGARLSDDFSGVGQISHRSELFLLSGLSGATGTVVQQNGTDLASRSSPLSTRNLKGPYVIGQQGNIDGEYWHGDITELIVYDRELKTDERDAVNRYLMKRYGLQSSIEQLRDPRFLALASLCHVLLNTNEFIYVD